ncbi:hypothetical protein GCK72_020289 [Caenorhabditis remanei]|uniref:T20D4.11-like domain-containing protein n=1 Tax=Caenorhabditis remanei TaxID=31234 RepID=A0A6A5GGU6_CAERE|nr:hypothetical protein GCK72_020289 [Caenorhabditis remanei]KAF1753732.1 hypothetical protein GCK72_020289 [Caenorhabditis remanei]
MSAKRLLLYVSSIFLISNVFANSNTSTNFGVGSCDSIISDFVIDLEHDNGSLNTTLMCGKVLKCLETLKSESGRKLKQLYDSRCEMYEFYSHEMMFCSQLLIDKRIYKGSSSKVSNCPDGYEFPFTNSEHQLLDYLNSVKPCVLDIASVYCSAPAANYLVTNYDQFINYMIVKPEYENCENVYVELNRYQCKQSADMIKSRGMWFSTYNGGSSSLEIESVEKNDKYCNKVKECSLDPWNILPLSKSLQHCEIVEALQSDFYRCLKTHGSLHPVSIEGCSINYSNRDCVKTTMAARCGSDAVVDFNRRYEWFNRNNLNQTLGNLRIDTNYSSFDEQNNQKNGIIEDTEVGKCAPVVDELVTLLSRRISDDFRKLFRIANETCARVMDCYESIGTPEALKLKKSYQSICDKVEFSCDDLDGCLTSFYSKQREGAYDVDKKDIFSRNLTRKRGGFLAGQSKFMKFAEGRCTKRAKRYLQLKYEYFVNLITTKPENDNCKSVFARTENVQCNEIIEQMYWKTTDLNEMDSKMAYESSKECQQAEKCMTGATCPSEDATKVLNWCESESFRGAAFYSCLTKLNKLSSLTWHNHYCAEAIVHKMQKPEWFLQFFKYNKDCLKIIMLEKCGSDAVRSFSEHFDHILKSLGG